MRLAALLVLCLALAPLRGMAGAAVVPGQGHSPSWMEETELSAVGRLPRPLLGAWPWAVGTALGAVPVHGPWWAGLAAETWASGRAEARMGAGPGIPGGRLLLGPLLSLRPGDPVPQRGLWLHLRVRGVQAQLRATAGGVSRTVDAWAGWRHAFSLGSTFSLWPRAWVGRAWGADSSRWLGGSAPRAVRWRSGPDPRTDQATAGRFEGEAWVPLPTVRGGLNAQALRLRLGVEAGAAPETGFLWGWLASLGVHLEVGRAPGGTAWLCLAASPDLAHRRLLLALSGNVPPARQRGAD